MYATNKKLTVIQFFGGPGVGKSTTAAELFALMKKRGYKVEFVHEYAKELVWENRQALFTEQDWIFAHQHRSIRRLVDHDIDYAIVDSSILLGLFYAPTTFPKSFLAYVREVFDSYDNINIFLNRNSEIPYVQVGRNQTEAEALELDARIRRYFVEESIDKYEIEAGDTAASLALTAVMQHSNKHRTIEDK